MTSSVGQELKAAAPSSLPLLKLRLSPAPNNAIIALTVGTQAMKGCKGGGGGEGQCKNLQLHKFVCSISV